MSETRISPRFPTDLPARVGFAPSRVLDLSETGVRIETGESLAPGRRCVLQIGDGGPRLAGVVARCKLVRTETLAEDHRPVYEAGIAFDLVSIEARGRIAALLDDVLAPLPEVLLGIAG